MHAGDVLFATDGHDVERRHRRGAEHLPPAVAHRHLGGDAVLAREHPEHHPGGARSHAELRDLDVDFQRVVTVFGQATAPCELRLEVTGDRAQEMLSGLVAVLRNRIDGLLDREHRRRSTHGLDRLAGWQRCRAPTAT
jgi:hypothetical protein